MHINRWLRTFLSAAILFLPAMLAAQTTTCKDTAEHRKLHDAMWNSCAQDSTSVVYDACMAFLAHAKADNDMTAANSSWVCGIMYTLGKMNISSAYHIVQGMKDDIQKRKSSKESLYYISNMMGHVYNTCGNISGAEAEFLKSAELVKGTASEHDGLPFVYLALAHVHLNHSLKQTLYWLDETEKELKKNDGKGNYYRCLVDVYAIRAIVEFKEKDYASFHSYIAKMEDTEKKNGTPSGDLFAPYARIYKILADGDTEKALEKADSLPDMKEQFLLKCDIYRYIGDNEKAFMTQRELMHKRDSITGVMIQENIQKQEDEIRLIKAEQKATGIANIVLTIAIVLAVIAIILLHRNLVNRRHYQKTLLAKNKELQEANKRVTAADEMKTEFIRSVSHEIRTPLNIINGFTQVLTNEENTFKPEERKRLAATIGHNTSLITSLVNKMLALANESTKDLLKEAEDTDALAICQRAIDNMPKTDPAKIKVMLDDQTAGCTTLRTNGDSLLLMLDNLLENSVKFTEQGHIILRIMCDAVEGRKMMHFTVEDTGCGIPADKVGTIFERFTKADVFKEGLGLGLAYCHETAEKLGGSLTLDRTSDEGTSFTLSLPIKLNT